MKNFSLEYILLFIFSGLIFGSCSGDGDNGGDFEEPKYESDAARYVITSPGSEYESVELTASGNYIITEKQRTYTFSQGMANAARMSFLKSANPAKTRATDNGIIYGKYTKKSDNEYYLDGFGIIVISSTGDNAYDLEITTNSGNSIVLGANRENMYGESTMTNKLCRTWDLKKAELRAWENGKFMGAVTVTKDNYEEIMGDDECPVNVVFTKAGTYMVIYSNGELAISTWKWEKESQGLLRYSWNYDALYDPEESGLITISFSGKNMVVCEEYEEEYDGEVYKDQAKWYFSEVR